MSDPDPAVSHRVAVRTLCEFTARSGDLSARFTPSPTAVQGMAGHVRMGERRGPAYELELTLRGHHGALEVVGRADGYDAARNRLEEWKTHRGALELMPANQRALHWAQLKVYGALLCAARRLERVELALVYLDLRSEVETTLTESAEATRLQADFDRYCALYLEWAQIEARHRCRRDAFLSALQFPLAGLHPGQRRMAEAVYKAACRGSPLMVQAPTGVGKTLGSLFPALKAMPVGRLDRLFFLVAKTSGRAPALDALGELGGGDPDAPLRVLEWVAKDSACVHPGRACDAAECPLARGFYDKLPRARSLALERSLLTREAVRSVAADQGVCPYYLSQELARWCDVVVGDYNHFFDGSAGLHALTVQQQWRTAVLVDEAHNLLPRARAMYSAALRSQDLERAMPGAPRAALAPLSAVRDAMRSLDAAHADGYRVLAAIPVELTLPLQAALAALSDAAATAPLEAAVLELFFAALQFMRLAESFGPHSLFDLTRGAPAHIELCIRNVDPARFLAPRFAACATAVVFSATLNPQGYYRRLLGLAESTVWLDVESPFAAHQLDVRVERRISTRFRDRARSRRPIADLMAAQYRAKPGNYLAFFGGFDYLQATLEVFAERWPEVPVWEQRRGMDAGERSAFLARFTAQGRGIGFAVLGGVFAEGIDLPGDRLIGAFIATLGLPQVNDVNAEMQRRMDELFDRGFEYTYLYPGLQRVVQAAGRVIRTVTDRGTLHLIDDRYAAAEVQGLLPSWWRVRLN